MRDHPIPPVTEPLQYRAIGVVRGVYTPHDEEQLTRGFLTDSDGTKLETVVLGRVLTLMRRHLSMDQPHLWVVYPRCREATICISKLLEFGSRALCLQSPLILRTAFPKGMTISLFVEN